MTSNRILLDSSILVEKAKRTRQGLFDALLQRDNLEKCICSTVLSEFAFHLLAIEGGKAPQTLKQNATIPTLLSANSPEPLLNVFTFLPDSSQTISLYLSLMIRYNLLPNDALILSACLLHEVPMLANYDKPDFELACLKEGIKLIGDVTDLT